MESGECSTSRPPQANRRRGNAFDGVTPYPSSTLPSVMKKGPCDVFINHRGCDTKHTLASTIYHTLRMNNIHAFLDVEDLELGDSVPVEIEKAMRTAGVHIAIFSERYAESAWCLAELCYMLQTGTPIIPVFYHVDPSDLRWVALGKGCYAPAFSQHEKERYSNMLQDWKIALQRVSNISGCVLNINNGDEMMVLKSIVNSALRILRKEPLEVAKHPVGMDEIVQDFEKSLVQFVENEEGVQIVGIAGLGGSGKTTLATEIYNRKSSSINRSSFLHDVRDDASRNVLHTKQKKLLGDFRIDLQSFEYLDNVKDGKAIIADRLRNLCVLIVLDDVDHEDQIDALVPSKERLETGSLVIITTRDVEVLTKWGITSIYKIKPLQNLHAKQLFCWHAFLQPFPLQGFEDLVESFLISCSGLPLSLKVIGGQLYGKRSREYWVSQLKKIQRILPSEILERLKVSYDALDAEEQEIFLDIACFFIDERKSLAIDVWDASRWSGLCSWEVLENKCLVEVDGKERIRMHDHLRDLGRQIAKTHSPQRIRFEKWPREMTICALQPICDPEFQSILDSFTFPGVDVHRMRPGVSVHRMREWSLTGHETNLSNAALVCSLVQCHSEFDTNVWIRKVESTRVNLTGSGNRWIVMCVFKEVSCLVENGGRGLLSLNVDILGEVLGGWVMVGERTSILYSLKKLFQTFSESVPYCYEFL